MIRTKLSRLRGRHRPGDDCLRGSAKGSRVSASVQLARHSLTGTVETTEMTAGGAAGQSIASGGVRTPLTLAVLSALLLTGYDASATSCVVSPKEGPLPPHMSAAADRFHAHQTDAPCGLVRRAEAVYQTRRDVAAGILTEEEGAALGGTALNGMGSMVVLPALYANSGIEPWNLNSLEIQLFVFSQTGTLNDYYEEISYGAFGVDGQVMEWVPVSGDDTDYEGSDNGYGGGAGQLLLETLLLNDGIVDFSQFDNDGPDGVPNSGDDDGFVDQLFIVHPEMGAECGGGASNNIWSHQYYFDAWFGYLFSTNDPKAGGGFIRINRYAMVPGVSCNGGMIEIGVFAHEFGHAIGIPDLYDTKADVTGDSEGIGWWGLMGAGNWNSPMSPAHMCAFSKYRLGWLDYLVVDNDLPTLCVPPVETRGTAVQVWSFGLPENEYFLVENRQAIGFDSQLPAEGFVIYHIDEDVYDAKRGNNQVNADETHKAIDIECADAFSWEHEVDADDLDAKNNRGDSGDVWCQGGVQNKFDALSTPSTLSYSGVPTPVAIKNISACNSTGGDVPADWICATFNVGASNPVDVCIEDCSSDNCNEIATCEDWWGSPDIWIDNDGDGIHDLPAAGIENKLWTRVHNLGPDIAVATTVQLYLAPGAVGLEWPTDAADYLGVTGFPVIGVGESEEDYIIFQYPDLFDLVGHYCIGAIVQQTYDPTFPTSAPLSNNIAQVNSQVLFARPGGAALAGSGADAEPPVSCPAAFTRETKVYVYDGFNTDGAVVTAEIRLGTHPNYDDAEIPSNWTFDILPTRGPFTLNPGVRDSVVVRFSSTSASHRERAYVPLTLWDLRTNRVIGGTTVTCEVDCLYPRSPSGGTAEWTDPAGDNPVGSTVLVEWNPVTVDIEGGPERVMLYEVFRSDDTPSPEVLVDRVAIDADPSSPKFQWFDDRPRGDCPIVYTYRVRAVDAAGAAGNHSGPIVLECETTSSPEIANRPDRRLEVFPNPMGRSELATVRFALTEPGSVDLSIYSAGGQRVRNLLAGSQTVAVHEVTWDGRDDNGSELPSGIYYCRMQAPGHQETQTVVRIR